MVAGLVFGVILFKCGTVSPCSVLREQVRQQDGLAAALPDSLVDTLLAAQYGALNPAKCLSGIAGGERPVAAKARQQAIAHLDKSLIFFAANHRVFGKAIALLHG